MLTIGVKFSPVYQGGSVFFLIRWIRRSRAWEGVIKSHGNCCLLNKVYCEGGGICVQCECQP